MSDSRRQWRDLGLDKKLSIVVIPLVVAAIGVGVPLIAKGGGGGGSPAPSPTAAPSAELQIVDLAVTGGDPDHQQAVDLTVRNTGDVVSVITRARLVVRDTGFVKLCQAGGGLEPSETYDVLLPPDAAEGETVEAKVSQQILPGSADRFQIRLDVPEPDRQLGSYLYQLDVQLLHDAARRPLPAGTVLVSAPFLPGPGLFWSGVEDQAAYEDPAAAEVKRCLQDNEATYKRMTALDGERSPQLSEQLLTPPS